MSRFLAKKKRKVATTFVFNNLISPGGRVADVDVAKQVLRGLELGRGFSQDSIDDIIMANKRWTFGPSLVWSGGAH